MDMQQLSERRQVRQHPAPAAMAATSGWVEVIAGPMFSGKTEELIRRLRRASLARQHVMVFQPAMDHRYRADALVSHAQASWAALSVADAAQIAAAVGPTVQVVGIDEAQFFGPALCAVVGALADAGVRVLVAGLDQDYAGAPFAPMPELMAMAEMVTKAQAVCVRCGSPAGRTYRLSASQQQVLVGAQQDYEARCRRCHLLGAAVTATAVPWALC